MSLKCDGVFEGGGVKGTGFVGAIASMEQAGYEFQNIAGTSAGSIVAALVAAGFSSEEMKEALDKLDYELIRGENILDHFGMLGKSMDIFLNFGIYNSDYFENWIRDLLATKNVHTFGDLSTGNADEKYKYKLQVIVSDITDQKMLVLPRDLVDFGFDPDKFSIATAVKMSMSIPVYFQPYQLTDIDGKVHMIVDGGLLSNYPVWLLDDGSSAPPWPTFGFVFEYPGTVLRKKENIRTVIDYTKAIVTTMLDAHDAFHISNSKGDYQRTICIPTIVDIDGVKRNIGTTDFDVTLEERDALFENGKVVGDIFLKDWNFDDWVKKYRTLEYCEE